MRTQRSSHLAFLLLSSFALLAVSSAQERKNYVVHLEPRDDASAADSLGDWHRSFLPEATLDSAGGDGPRIIHSYTHVLTGFAARLTEAEAESLRTKEGCLRLYPEEFLPLATTHSPGFLGLHLGKDGFWSRSGFGRGVVIGLLDTGILPSHPSFGDAGMPPPPKKWKGTCQFRSVAGGGCNNKVIGARAFGSAAINNTAPPVDDAGHGTHTASTAAGNFVQNADVRGNAHGTASGMAPHAHLAIYKVCARSRCSIMDIIAGLDAAVKDGVDVLSFSISATDGAQFNYDLIAVATFKAMEHGIFVSAAAGNDGPIAGTMRNGAPWMLTVAAGTTDRAIRTTVRLGNGQELDGESLFQPRNNTAGRPLPLVFPGRNGDPDARDCSTLVEAEVRGKVVLCESRSIGEHVEQGQMVSAYGGAGMILMNKAAEGYTTFADAHVLPASHVSYAAGSKIAAYIKSTAKPTASITFRGTVMGSSPAPSVAFFSSRGPNKASPGILKPDITGPGMNILAAWAPSEMHPEFVDDVSLTFFMESGTSMSTPHLSGIAAVIKSLHPSWSPAAIKSAIMTSSNTADHAGVPIKDEQYRRASFYSMGAGYVNPSRAVDPGLVYDLGTNEYIAYLCGLGLGDDGVKEVTGRRIACAKLKAITEAELNYPSLVVKLLSQPITVRRTVTNVGKADSVYTAVVDIWMETDRIRMESDSDNTFYHIFTRIRIRIRMFSNTNTKRMFRIRIRIGYLLDLKDNIY